MPALAAQFVSNVRMAEMAAICLLGLARRARTAVAGPTGDASEKDH
jgi:hypothetical protein